MKLLAIDDQSVVLQLLRSQIKTEQLNLECLDMVTNTQSARRLFESCVYDIVLCDIEMPGEDGISFAKWVLDQYPAVKLIFLTSHMDFSYMKQAIAMHSFDYVLQPADEIELNQTIQKAIFEIQIEKKQKEMLNKGKLYDAQENSMIGWMFMRWLKEGVPMEAYIQNALQKRHPQLTENGDVCLLSVTTVEKNNQLECVENTLAEFILSNITDELFENHGIKSFFIKDKKMTFTGILYSVYGDLNIEMIRQGLMDIKDHLSSLLSVKTSIIFTESGQYSKLRDLYARLNKYSVENTRPTYEVTLIGEGTEIVADESLEVHVRNWKKMIQSREFDCFGAAVLCYIGRLSAGTLFNTDNIANIHSKFTEVLFSYLAENDINTSCIFSDEMSYSDYMSKYATLESFRSMVLYIVERLKQIQCRDLDPVSLVRLYIRKNIGESLSVTEVAEYVNLSPEYLTRLLKKRTGYSLKEYLTYERLEAAKMLLETTTLSVTSISAHVGYDNYNNFIKIFKKYEGCTPSEYRKFKEGG